MASKSKKFKKLKKKLIDRINKASKYEDLKAISRTLDYYPVLKDSEEWDYCYLFYLLRFKLRKMRDYFRTAEIAMDSKIYAQQIDKTIKLLDIGFLNDEVETDRYVNLRNAERFLSRDSLEFYRKVDFEHSTEYLCNEVRIAKARALFAKYFVAKVLDWWD